MLGENWKILTASLCRFNRFVLPNDSRSRLTIRNDSKELSLAASSFFGAFGWFLKSMTDMIFTKGDNIKSDNWTTPSSIRIGISKRNVESYEWGNNPEPWGNWNLFSKNATLPCNSDLIQICRSKCRTLNVDITLVFQALSYWCKTDRKSVV